MASRYKRLADDLDMVRKAPRKNNKKRNVRRKKNNKPRRFIGSKAARIALAALLVVGGAKVYDWIQTSQATIAKVVDYSGDEYDGKMPIYDENGKLIAEIDENSLVVTISKLPKDESERVYVGAINSNGESIIGQTERRYLEEVQKVDKDKIEEYSTVYTVIPDSGVNIRKSAEVSGDNKLGAIECGEQVLGAAKLQASDNEFLWVPVMYINEEEVVEGYIRSDLLRENGEIEDVNIIDEKENESNDRNNKIPMIVDTSKESSVDLKLRSDTKLDKYNIIAEIPNGTVINAIGSNIKTSDAIDWREVEYTDKDGKVYTGWVSNSFLKEYDVVEMKVDTAKEGRINLNVRRDPGTGYPKVAEIEHGTVLKIPKVNFEEIKNVDGVDWILVTLSDGTSGYVSCEYLKEVEKEKEEVDQSEIVNEVIDKRVVSRSGNVVGIDVADGVSGDALEMLLSDKNVIKDQTARLSYYDENGKAVYANTNTSDIAGNINFVYIKLGASGYGNFVTLLNDNYLDQVAVCEKYEIPYGFYYYSTCIDNNEAKAEANAINKALDSVKSRKYNLLPLAIDVELASGSSDRQWGKDVTEAKAYLANLIEPTQGKTILYGGGRSISSSSPECVLNIDRYNELLESGETNVWLATPRTDEGGISTDTQEYISTISKDADIAISQTVLDARVNNTGIDINTIEDDKYVKMIKKGGDEIEEIVSIDNEER